MTNWQVDSAYKLTKNDAAAVNEYSYSGLDLTTTSEFKIVSAATSDGTYLKWFPEIGNNYGSNGEITADAKYTVYFRPDYNGNADWYCNAIYVAIEVPEESQAVIDMINALPDAANVTTANEQAIAAARKAYDDLSDTNKTFVSADTLAKLEAAEDALIPELVNRCFIENDTDKIYSGDEITVSGAAEGGKGEYTYAFYYKKTSGTNWLEMAPAYTTESASFTPAVMVNYDVKTVVKDARGVTAEKILTFKAKKPLTNDSATSAEEIAIGEKIVVTGAASGGAKGYTYAFYYKKSSKDNWYAMAPAFTTKRASVTPSAGVSYDVKVIVKDADGNTEEKLFTVKVTKPLTNESTISAEEIVLGENVVEPVDTKYNNVV